MGLTSSTISNPDFVVVGGGSAGCVVASRLSENPNVTVVLVEAGGSDDQFNINTPLASKLLQGSNVDWAYKTAPQEHACLAHNERRSAWPRGRVLGGCSSINYMAYVRGNKADYDLWAELGCEGWAYNDVLPYFLKSEKQTAPRLAESKYHSTQGPMGVSDLKHTNILSRTFVDACEEVGIPKTEDYNGENQLGAGMCQATQLNGERVTTARAFLRSVGKRPNLSILTNAQVTRILFNENKEATGIAYVLGKGKPEQTLLAKKEVILSAGAVGSPHILLLSGVGPRKHLEEMGIPVVADLPVGENLQDHLVVPLPFLSDLDGYFEPKVNTVGNLLSYVTSKSGPFSSNGLECTAFVQTGKSPDLGGAPDIQMHLFAAIGDKKDVVNFNYIPASINQEMLKKPLNGMTLLAVLLHPRSKGRVTLSSKDPLAHPVLDPHYLEDPHDVEVLVEGCKLAARIAGAQAYVNAGANLKAISMLEKFCEHPVGSDEYLADYTRRTASTLYHPIGTCRMGPADAPSSVVDPRCRVLGGIKRLRVIDASIMPTLPSGNTNAPAIMVGERGVEFVIKDL